MSYTGRWFKRAVCSAAAGVLALALGGCAHTNPAPVEKPRYDDLGKDASIPSYLNGTIKSLAVPQNTGVFPVSSYGLVTGLHRTGDSTAPTIVREWMTKQMYAHGLGSATLGTQSLQPEQMLLDPHFAIVTVVGYIPPGARVGDPLDITVQALPYPNTTTSLADGVLYRTELHINGTSDPFGSVNIYGKAQGNIFVNPAYALNAPTTQPSVRQSLRSGTIPGGGFCTTDRPIILRARTPGWTITRAIQLRINQFFQVNDSDFSRRVAAAQDDGLVNLYVPPSFHGDWKHFLGLVKFLYMNGSPEFATLKARELAEAIVKPNAFTDDISYAWEGLGPAALPFITPLLTHPSQEVQYSAARAAAFLGDRYGEDMLLQIARTPNHAFQVNAVQSLADLPRSATINAGVADLLNASNALVRIEAYNLLIKQNDPRILTKVVHPPGNAESAFFLDMVPSDGPPLVYCTRVGVPRVAVFGRKVMLNTPMTFSAFDTRLLMTTMDDAGKPRQLKIIYRDPGRDAPVQAASSLDVSEFIARLGGLSDEGLHFSYGDIVAILQTMADPKTQKLAAAFKLQDPRMDSFGADSFVQPVGTSDGGRPQSDKPAAGQAKKSEDPKYPAGLPESMPRGNNATTVGVDAPRPQ